MSKDISVRALHLSAAQRLVGDQEKTNGRNQGLFRRVDDAGGDQ
jgi:hypothetical protein